MKIVVSLLLAVVGALTAAADRAFTVHVWAAVAPNAAGDPSYGLVFKGDRRSDPPRVEYALSYRSGCPEFKYMSADGVWQGVMVSALAGTRLNGRGFSVPVRDLPRMRRGVWQLVTGVYDRGRVALYLDGTLVAETKGNPPPPPNDCPVRLGVVESAAGRPFWRLEGKTALFAAEDRAFTADDVRDLLAREKASLPSLPPPLVREVPSFANVLPRTAAYCARLAENPPPRRTGNCTARVTVEGGVPRLEINGKVECVHAMMPLPYAPEKGVIDSCREFAACGVRVFSNILWTRGKRNDWWLGEGRYDWARVDAWFRALIAAAPDGWVFPRLKTDPPDWWAKGHPEEFHREQIRPASAKWRDLRRRMIRDFVEHVEGSDYAAYVIGYHLGAMSGSEWVAFPLSDEIRRSGKDVADALLDEAHEVKELVHGRKITGAFFGYEMFSHADFPRILASPDVDFICAPYCYDLRRGGDAGASQVFCRASCLLHGKLFFDETDIRTHYADTPEEYKCETKEESVGTLKRAVGMALAFGQDAWWFLLAGNETFHDADYMEVVARGTDAFRRATAERRGSRGAEVALFHRMDASAHRLRDRRRLFVLDVLPRCGSPCDIYRIEDYDAVEKGRYKVCLMPEDELLPLEALKAKLKAAGVFSYLDAPDVTYAGFGHLTVHATTAGRKTVRLPAPCRVEEIFGAPAPHGAVKDFEVDLAAGETRVYRLLP